MDKALDQQLIAQCREALDSRTPVRFSTKIADTNRTVGTMLGHEVTKAYWRRRTTSGTIDITRRVRCSFGAFVPRGVTLRVRGDAQRLRGQGLSGGRIVLRPSANAQPTALPRTACRRQRHPVPAPTSGQAFIRGTAGALAVRNSGATAVSVVGDHGCSTGQQASGHPRPDRTAAHGACPAVSRSSTHSGRWRGI